MWQVWIEKWKDVNRQTDWLRTNQGDVRFWHYKKEALAVAKDMGSLFRIERKRNV